MNPTIKSLLAPAALFLFLGAHPAEASFMDTLSGLWQRGSEAAGGLYQRGKEAVSGLIGGGSSAPAAPAAPAAPVPEPPPAAPGAGSSGGSAGGSFLSDGLESANGLLETGKEKVKDLFGGKPNAGRVRLANLLEKIEAAQVEVAAKGDNVGEYLFQLGSRRPGPASRPYLAERYRDLGSKEAELGRLYGQLNQAIADAGGAEALDTEEIQKIGAVQRLQQTLVANSQRIREHVDRALANTDEAESIARTQPLSGDAGEGEAPAAASDATAPAAASDAPPEEILPDGVGTADGPSEDGVYVQRSGEYSGEVQADGTIVKADSAADFGVAEAPADQIKADQAAAFEAGADDDGAEDGGYGAAARPDTDAPIEPAGTRATEPSGTAATEADAGELTVAGDESDDGGDRGPIDEGGIGGDETGGEDAGDEDAGDDADREFDPDDPEMGAYIDDWLAATELDEYGRWLSPAQFRARGAPDTGGLSRRAWVYRVVTRDAGMNLSLQEYVAARMSGENPALFQERALGSGDGSTGGRAPSRRSAIRDRVGETEASGPAAAGASPPPEGEDPKTPVAQRADYQRLQAALKSGDPEAIRAAYKAYSSR